MLPGSWNSGNGYQINSAGFTDINFGKNNLGAKYTRVSDDKYKVDISGKSGLTMEPVIDDQKNSESQEKNTASYELAVNLQQVLLKEGQKIIDCFRRCRMLQGQYCASGRLRLASRKIMANLFMI